MKASKILPVILFAGAFAFVEAAVVVYLRHLLGVGFNPPQTDKEKILVLTPGVAFLDPRAALPIIRDSAILKIERLREAATLVMLAVVAYLAGKRWLDKVAYFLLAFGVWDIFYYIFLRLTIGWPHSFGDLDIFFLLPGPWVGPVITPLAASALMIVAALLLLNKSWKNEKQAK